MNPMLMTTVKRRKEQEHTEKQCAIFMPLRNSGILRWDRPLKVR